MPKYDLVVTKAAVKDVEKLSQPIKKRLKQKLVYFLNLSDPLAQAKRLTNTDIGDYRWRVGDYRVAFDVDDSKIVILRIRHRREIYRKQHCS
jgi:mRNA interferase RelE/StbE